MKNSGSPVIITFIGPVGVGKSTQIRLLKKFLESKNKKSIVTYIKSVHGFTYILSGLIGFLLKTQKEGDDIAGYSLKQDFYKRIYPLWVLSETVSIIGKFFFTVYLPYQLGYSVLIEEGLKMTIANYRLFRPHFLGIKPVKLPFIGTLSNWVMSKKHIEIVLDADNHELISRRSSRRFRRYETKVYENLQRQVMSQLKGKHTLYINTTGKSTKSIHNIIVGTVNGII